MLVEILWDLGFATVGAIAGAYSHKWLAAEAKKAGIDPESLAAKAKADLAEAKATFAVAGKLSAAPPPPAKGK